MQRMTVAEKNKRDKQPAFLLLSKHGEGASLWVNRTLLPNIATALQRHQHPSLQDLSIACTQIYRREREKHNNEDCSIRSATTDAAYQDSVEPIPGAFLTFGEKVLEAASRALMGSKNRAIGKIGLDFRDIQREK